MANLSIHDQDLAYIHAGIATQHQAFRGATVLITGCGGFLGYYFMHYFAAYAQELGIKRVIGLDSFILGEPFWMAELKKNPVVSIHAFDITKHGIADIPGAADANFIIHMASIASPIFYRKHPLATLDANIWGLRALLDYYLTRDVRGFLFFSSSEIYGDPDAKNIPTNEDYRGLVSCTGPRACYDESKRFGETMCGVFAREFGFQVSVARPFNNYGPGMRLNDQRVPADFAKAVLAGRDIEILSDGSPTRTFCYVADALVGYLKVLLHRHFDAFNIGIATPEISVAKLADIYTHAAAEVFGYRGQVRLGASADSDYLTDNPNRRCPDIAKAQRVLDYHPTIGVEEGVRRFLTFLKEQPKWAA